ncbi:MAG: saccharopine dehydrogenase C-terminal domain-containing protein [Gemmatimonadales bacterium]|nr:saccharopine dehydrogenase C-terminal domain-containing protein [Gemmatimonadales bacterium]
MHTCVFSSSAQEGRARPALSTCSGSPPPGPSPSPTSTSATSRHLIAMRVDVRGAKGGRPAGTRWQMVDRYDGKHHVTSMMRTTGYSLAITGIMQLDGRISAAGVQVPEECVPAQPYIDELKQRGVVIEESAL